MAYWLWKINTFFQTETSGVVVCVKMHTRPKSQSLLPYSILRLRSNNKETTTTTTTTKTTVRALYSGAYDINPINVTGPLTPTPLSFCRSGIGRIYNSM